MHADDPETMATMRTWLQLVSTELGVDPSLVFEAEEPLLGLISAVAHGPSRPGAPLTAFLVGVATGQGRDASQLAERVGLLAAGYQPATAAQ